MLASAGTESIAAPNTALGMWFSYLACLQSSCNDTSVDQKSAKDFAATPISSVLTTDIKKATFLTNASTNCKFNFSNQDLTGTFGDLLNSRDPIAELISDLIQKYAVDPFPAGDPKDFWNSISGKAFPGGSGSNPWKQANAALSQNMDPTCYSATQQTKVATLIDTADSKIGAVVVSQIATFA